jgi:hypothetical protein
MPTRKPAAPAAGPPVGPADLPDLLDALRVAADWTEADIECANCGPQCDLHAAHLAQVRRWRDIAARLSPSTPDTAEPVVVKDHTEYAVQYRYPDDGDDDWFDTRPSPLETLAGARHHRARYNREIGNPSRVIRRHIRETLIDP